MAAIYDHGERHYDAERALKRHDDRISELECELEEVRGAVRDLKRAVDALNVTAVQRDPLSADAVGAYDA